mmetsp:Transcript_26210/g.63702  ORF Transcript_26210/g.63702 Transcript_26210/m.63702 type:complete len:217 (-) Transcript_26210:46-696(-)
MQEEIYLVPLFRTVEPLMAAVPRATSGNNDDEPPTPPEKQRKVKVYANPTPARSCHICARRRDLVSCSNLRLGTCRKSFCPRCAQAYGVLYITHQGISVPDPVSLRNWICSHCRNACPANARCIVYYRSSARRRERNRLRREGSDETQGSSSDQHLQDLLQSLEGGEEPNLSLSPAPVERGPFPPPRDTIFEPLSSFYSAQPQDRPSSGESGSEEN